MDLLFFTLLLSLVSSLAVSIIGSFVVLKRITMIAGSISHSILWGMGLAIWLQQVHKVSFFTPLLGAFIAAIVGGLLVGFVTYYSRKKEESSLSMIWSLGMALGVIFLAKTPSYTTELSDFLFGNILFATHLDLALILGVDVLLVVSFTLLHKQFLAIMFDESHARLQGVNSAGLHILSHVLIALCVVVLVQIVGVILSLTLLALPAAIARTYTKTFLTLVLLTFAISFAFCVLGIVSAYFLNLPVGASIAAIASIGYCITLLLK